MSAQTLEVGDVVRIRGDAVEMEVIAIDGRFLRCRRLAAPERPPAYLGRHQVEFVRAGEVEP